VLLPANRQNNNERTKTPRKRVSLLPFVLPLKRCHRNSLPSSCIVQTRLLFFFSFQILSVGRFFFFLKPLKKAPSRGMERVESFESRVPVRKKTNERKSSSFLIAKQQQQQQQQQQQHHATEEEDDKDDEGTNTTTRKGSTTTTRNEETQNAIEDASS